MLTLILLSPNLPCSEKVLLKQASTALPWSGMFVESCSTFLWACCHLSSLKHLEKHVAGRQNKDHAALPAEHPLKPLALWAVFAASSCWWCVVSLLVIHVLLQLHGPSYRYMWGWPLRFGFIVTIAIIIIIKLCACVCFCIFVCALECGCNRFRTRTSDSLELEL